MLILPTSEHQRRRDVASLVTWRWRALIIPKAASNRSECACARSVRLFCSSYDHVGLSSELKVLKVLKQAVYD